MSNIYKINEIKKLKIGDKILIQNNSIFNNTMVDCIIENYSIDKTKFKLKYKFLDGSTQSTWVDFNKDIILFLDKIVI